MYTGAMNQNAQGLIDIGALILKFAKVNRLTLHEDGTRFESDTDHSVMLAVCACALVDKLYKGTLDVGLVSQFALVHDLVEVHVGDTNTINITEEGKKEKIRKETESLHQIEKEFGGVYPWIHRTIEAYEREDTREARFVKILDKTMTKITNILNKGAALHLIGTTKEDIEKHFTSQANHLREKYGNEFSELLAISDSLMETMIQELYV
jgi:5'-deoxynucleotidase YfbR-like HD superfamily hydrolase